MTDYVSNFYMQELERSRNDLEYWRDMLSSLRKEGLEDHDIYGFTVENAEEAKLRISH